MSESTYENTGDETEREVDAVEGAREVDAVEGAREVDAVDRILSSVEVPSTEPPPPEVDPMVVAAIAVATADVPAVEPTPESRDHYVIAEVNGRRVPVWDSRLERDEFTRAEAGDVAAHYAKKMRATGVGAIRYDPVEIEAYRASPTIHE